MHDATRLTSKEKNALLWAQKTVSIGHCVGRQRIVSMQALELEGFVQRITVNGMIADWRLTQAGKEWRP